MTKEMIDKIHNNPKYKELVGKRRKFAWQLTILILVVYYTFILLIAFSPETLGTKISPDGVATWGIPVGIAILLFAFALTGIYIKRANSEFDPLVEEVKKEIKDMK
ncbi:MAG TPA: DUF485 domain-containing protein [Nitratifractor sp.]|jgi:uncharacterized membrane protein (DUF485 family)|nr:DUF485 domain-containing protein [Nitratifractor sp.]